jgi:hypothetical protein
MRLNSTTTAAVFLITDPATGRTWAAATTDYLTQERSNLMRTPDMPLQLAHAMAKDFEARGIENPEVRAILTQSLNGGTELFLANPTVDLTKERQTLRPMKWVLTQEESTKPPPPETYVTARGLAMLGIEGGRVFHFSEGPPHRNERFPMTRNRWRSPPPADET